MAAESKAENERVRRAEAERKTLELEAQRAATRKENQEVFPYAAAYWLGSVVLFAPAFLWFLWAFAGALRPDLIRAMEGAGVTSFTGLIAALPEVTHIHPLGLAFIGGFYGLLAAGAVLIISVFTIALFRRAKTKKSQYQHMILLFWILAASLALFLVGRMPVQ